MALMLLAELLLLTCQVRAGEQGERPALTAACYLKGLRKEICSFNKLDIHHMSLDGAKAKQTALAL